MGKTISNPKLFTLDNQGTASITQGEQIPVCIKWQKAQILHLKMQH